MKIIWLSPLVCILICCLSQLSSAQNEDQAIPKDSQQIPNPFPTASYISLDGLTLVIVFDKSVNFNASLEAFEKHRSALLESDPNLYSQTSHNQLEVADPSDQPVCQDPRVNGPTDSSHHELDHENSHQQHLIQGIQLCAKLLTKKTLKILHKYSLSTCIWATQTQLIIKLARPAQSQLRIAFQIGAISGQYGPDQRESVSVQLNRLPLESLGVPLNPKIGITGPNQVSTCGQFTLSVHLWSPFGTSPGESINIKWSVERLAGFVPIMNTTNDGSDLSGNKILNDVAINKLQQLQAQQDIEASKWRRLQELVGANRANNLVLDAQLLQFMPQIYHFHVTVTFMTNLKSIKLNATHRVGRLDYEAPISTIYGTHILTHQPALNTNRDTVLVADFQVPECTNDIKQVGMYWQVSDSRVKFEQTYAPFYIAKAQTLPEQSSVEFRLNSFYGIRVKRYASTYTLLTTGDYVIDAEISGGVLAMSLSGWQANEEHSQLIDSVPTGSRYLELYGPSTSSDNDRYQYQWSCFDGKTAAGCVRNSKLLSGANSTHYEVDPIREGIVSGSVSADSQNSPKISQNSPLQANSVNSTTHKGIKLIDSQMQTQPILRIPSDWLEAGSQLWFGLQRSDRQSLHGPHRSSQTEYALIAVQPGNSPIQLSIGPVLLSRFRIPISLRNPLTGALILPSGVPIVLVGRAEPPDEIRSISWHSANYMYPLHWTLQNETNPSNGRIELMSELHLNPSLLVESAHYQFQLVVCSQSGSTSSASLSVDIASGISGCKVEVSQSQQSNSLLISVDFCNIPLDLSPLTYQIYVAETGEALQESLDPMSGQTGESLNETDERQLGTQMQVLTPPQFTPTFYVSNSVALALLSSELNSSDRRIVSRFGARVCDRLQACRMFYSAPFSLRSPTSNLNQSIPLDRASSQVEKQRLRLMIAQLESQSKLIQSMRSMIESSRRINLAGNSVAAISVLSSAIDLGQKLLLSDELEMKKADGIDEHNGKQIQVAPEQRQQQLIANGKVKDLIQVATRDCLHYCNSVLQRHFQLTDSGQTNLVTQTLAKILSLQVGSYIEFKFKAVKLLSQITRKSIREQLNLKQNCIADVRSLQSAYESIFGSFNHYTIEMYNEDRSTTRAAQHDSSSQTSRLTHGGSNRTTMTATKSHNSPDLPLSRITMIIPNSQLISPSAMYSHQLTATTENNKTNINTNPSSSARISNQLTDINGININYTDSISQTTSIALNRKRSEEAILAYLKSIRSAYRSIIAAAAIQLQLGDVQLLHYSVSSNGFTGSSGDTGSDTNNSTSNSNDLDSVNATIERDTSSDSAASRLSNIVSSSISPTDIGSGGMGGPSGKHHNSKANPSIVYEKSRSYNYGVKRKDSLESELISTDANTLTNNPSSDIVSSLRHVTSFNTDTIDIDLHRYGSISVKLSPRLMKKFRFNGFNGDANSGPANVRCFNDTAKPSTRCSSFVISVTSFAGKAPFRSLDHGLMLKVPILDISLISPIDGSDLLELMDESEVKNIHTIVTFFSPPGAHIDTAATVAASEIHRSPAQQVPQSEPYKCYQFDDSLNEWSLADSAIVIEQAGVSDDGGATRDGTIQSDQIISCTFRGLGTFGAFQGKPAPVESPLSSLVVVGSLGVAGLVLILTILGCLASDWQRSSASKRNSKTDRNGGYDDSSYEIEQHPEQNGSFNVPPTLVSAGASKSGYPLRS